MKRHDTGEGLAAGASNAGLDAEAARPQAVAGHVSRKRGPMKANISFDATDHAIVDQLRKNGRATNQQIAETLGLTATTVSTRIRRMEEANQLRVVAVSDFSAHGYDLLLKVAIEVDGRPASEVANDLAKHPEVFAVHLVTGRYDIDMLVALREFDDLSTFLLEKITQVRGIRSMNPSIFVDIIKYQFDVAPIETGN
jgi:DNA-binding Lrp family transcriptional regulator